MNPNICIYHGNGTIPFLAYLAGLIDGEGHIAVSRTHTSASAKGCRRGFSYRSSITVALTHKETLEWTRSMTGLGTIAPKKTKAIHKAAWTWGVWSIEAMLLAELLLPYLRIKQFQAKNLIAFQRHMRRPGSKGLTDIEWGERLQRYEQSKLLNKRGAANAS